MRPMWTSADVDLNRPIGFNWKRYEEQSTVPTPGQSRRRYIAGATPGGIRERSVE